MQKLMLATDVILEALIGPSPIKVDRLISQARNGEVQFEILDLALCGAFYSVDEDDVINVRRLAQLLQYAQLIPDCPEYLGPGEREGWVPTAKEVANWRKCALGEGGDFG